MTSSWCNDRAVDAVHWKILKKHLKPNVWSTSRDMLKYKQELDAARHAELNQLASSVQEMKNKLSYLKKTALDINKIKTVGFESFRKDIKSFECKLLKLKEESLKKLREENLKQRRLMEEIERVRNLVLNDAAVSKPHDSAPNKKKETATFKRIPISKNSYPSKEIADFHDFCDRNYGLTGGWSSKDHETFLKIRSKNANNPNFIDHVAQAMPHISVDAARAHESWFVKFEELKAKQKEVIMKWKNDKKKLFLPDCCPKDTGNLRIKHTDEKVESTLKISCDRLNELKNESHTVSELQHKVEMTKHSNCDKALLKRFRENDKKFIESKNASKQRLASERTSEQITIVTLHGKSESYGVNESLEKLPNVQFSIFGASNQDVRVVLKYQ